MGFTDTIKGLVKGNKAAIKGGVDQAAKVVESKAPDAIDPHVAKGADVIKDAVDKID